MIRLVEMFHTIQGEGFNAGKAAVFCRVPFCNLACTWCDTQFDTFKEYSEEDIKAYLHQSNAPLVVITGGEPSFSKESKKLIEVIKNSAYIAMESNGQFLAPEGVDFLTISPKRWSAKPDAKQPHEPFWFNMDNKPSEIKLVVDSLEVFDAAQKIAEDWKQEKFKFKGNARFYLSPEWGSKDEWLPYIVKFVQQNPLWRISLQTHKILNVR